MNWHKMSTRNSDMIKLQHYCTGSGARLETYEKYYEDFVEKVMRVLENDKVKILWDFSIQSETKIDHNQPYLILLEKKEICYIVNVACLLDP